MKNEKSARDLLRDLRRRLGLSPMRRLMRAVEARGFRLRDANAVELFGGSGSFHTLDYARRVAQLEVWELDEKYRPALQANLPGATLLFGDTYQMLNGATATFDMIVADNPMSHHGDHCEHFDLFPHIFRLAGPRALIITDVIPYAPARARARYPYLFNAAQLERRAEFYQTATPQNVPLDSMPAVYQRHALQAGYRLEWHVFQRRHFVHYLAMMAVRP